MKPEYICIGLPKAGTSWLYNVLKRHNDVYVPPVKEISYFSNKGFLYKKNIWAFFFHKDWYNVKKREYFKQFINSIKPYRNKNLSRKDQIWILKYCFLPQNDFWYRKLFSESKTKISIDISPVYSFLDEEEIESISKRFPKTSIILILRDPVERAWSHFKMDYLIGTNNKSESFSEDEIKAYYNRQPDNNKLISKWLKHYSSDRFKILQYEELQHNPESFYKSVCNIMQINPDGINRAYHDVINTISNKGHKLDIPDNHKRILIDIYGKNKE
ncbi:MAG: sulfotransferase [Bacteroidia bacterium]|nr:sulfotransferase [Bacteroidia bacterium]